MTTLFKKLFIKNYKDVENPAVRTAYGTSSGILGIIANSILFVVKLIASILSGSIAIVADAINNLTDFMTSIITMVGFKISGKSADKEHPFGHARYEYIAGLMISMLVVLVGFELGKSSIEKIISPTLISFSLLSAGILLVSAIAKISLFFYNNKIAKKINSDALKATAIDCRNDAMITTAVLIAMIIEWKTSFTIDGYMGILIAGFIMYSGIKLTLETMSPILGKKNDEELKNKIIEKISEYPIVIGYHDLMIHDYGPGTSFCSIHFEIDKNLDPLYVHEIIDKFEREFLDMGVSLTVHYDPVVTDSPELNALKHAVVSELVAIDNRLSTHDFRSIPCDGFTKVFFDVPLPEDIENKKEEIETRVNNALNALEIGKYEAIITFDSEAFN